MHARQRSANLQNRRFVIFRVTDFKNNVIKPPTRDSGSRLGGRREIPRSRDTAE